MRLTVAFRIRNLDTDDRSEYEQTQRVYFEHLARFSKSSNTDLWKFFCQDFFHDGGIESIQITADLKNIVMRLGCPNIKRFLSNGDFEYVSATFECTFHNIVNLHMEDRTAVEWGDLTETPAMFLHAEINTSPLLKTLDVEDKPYSLLIEMLSGDNIIWLEIVFSQVDVVPDEPLAFSLMEADPNYEVPTYCHRQVT
jgi:hypothetical protein